MVPSRLSAKVVLERLRWVRRMIAEIRALPLDSLEAFTVDVNIPAAAESYLRRGLEALLDLGRHILAKGFARAPAEYKEIANELRAVGILNPDEARLMRDIAGYRNRMVHFYSEVTIEELHRICTENLPDIERLVDLIERWIREHPDLIDREL